MQTKKMSLANIKGKLSRAEMKNIMAGNVPCTQWATCDGNWGYGRCNGAECCTETSC